MRKMKKGLAIALSAAMVTGMSMPALAAEQEVSVDAPIFAYDVTNVIVPTNFLVAFNPNGLDVDMNGIDESNPTDGVTNNQIVSKNYGIINKSTKDKVITVTLKVEDLNENKITFAADPADVTSATEDQYVINLTVVPANATEEVKVGGNSANLTTTGADLADVTMTAATSAQQTLVAGENDVDFLLKKADYEGTIDLGSATGNNVTGAFNIKNLESTGKGITAFTFGGTMNAKADWTKLTRGIRITAVYGNENAPDGAAAETGTGALYNNPNPVFKAGSGVGTIKYKPGTGNDAVASITSITMENNGQLFDGYHAAGGAWAAATDENGLITFQPGFIVGGFDQVFLEETHGAVVTYVTVGGDTKTATVNIRLRENPNPVFSTGSAVGTINYTSGSGNYAIASITSITLENNGQKFDGYHASGSVWSAATDENGLITFQPGFIVGGFDAVYPSESVHDAEVTYVTVGGETKTVTVGVRIR